MQIKTHTITITEDEKDTLGAALEDYIINSFEYHMTFESYRLLNEDNLDLLHDFINMGYRLTISNEDWTDFEMKYYPDAWEWAEAKFNKIKDEAGEQIS